MPLYILVPMIAIGLPLVVALVYWNTRDWKALPLGVEAAKSRFLKDFPAFMISTVTISDNGNSALLFSDTSEKTGLVYAVGQNHLTRLLVPDGMRQINERSWGIDLYLNDFTLKKVCFPLADDAQRRDVLMKMQSYNNKA